jgi:hypothetical protein
MTMAGLGVLSTGSNVDLASATTRPANDAMSSATTLATMPTHLTQSTIAATTEPGEPLGCRNIGATVWYKFDTQARGIIEVTVTTGQNGGREFMPVLALYSGADRNHLSRLGCEGSPGNSTNLGGVNLPAATYWVQVGGAAGDSGDLNVDVETTNTSGSGGSRSGAVMDSSSCTANVLNANDDSSTGLVPLPFELNFYGRSYSSLYVNNNGNVTFDGPLSTYTPFGLSATTRAIIAPFFADVDTRSGGSDPVKYGYGQTLYEGRPAFCVNWVNVGYYSGHVDKTNSFQLLLVDRSDVATGGFDIVFNYDRVAWETGDASGGANGFGGASAVAGFSNGDGTAPTSYQLPGSAVNGALLDSNPGSGLAVNSQSSSQLGRYVYAVRNGTPSCAGDADCDGLSDITERYLGTSTTKADTDGDGLKDSWEVDPSVAGAGIRLPNGHTVSRDDVFGPYGGDSCADAVDGQLRPKGQYRCLNQPPDPRHKNVYLEVDWQDCTVGGCPEVISNSDDTLHHAPNVNGLRDTVDMFARAPVSNPDGRGGVHLDVLVDERTPHKPNCLQAGSASNLDRPGFGTVAQRSFSSPDVLDAKALAVRYLWSGHSSSHATVPGQPDPCPDPSRLTFLKQGVGHADLAGYDYSPFGSAQIDGSYLVASLGIMWNCPSAIGANSASRLIHGVLGPCYRETEANLINPNPLNIVDPGIFPAHIDTPDESSKYVRWPISRMMGENESEAGRQLWSRTVAHLLGHALGLSSDGDVRNEPAPAGRKQASHTSALAPLAPDTYSTWTGLDLAAGNRSGPRSTEAYPNLDLLGSYSASLSDPDNDGVLEADDNCPGVYNPDQSNDDNGRFHLGNNTAEFGDACDPDIDGDGQRNVTPGEGETSVSQPALRTRSATTRTAATTTSPTADGLDPMPYDTNNDGEDNAVDTDDDGDGVPDDTDDCRLDADPAQVDTDNDGAGNACDSDADGDGVDNTLESELGSDPLRATSTPEYVGVNGSCSDGLDNDGDGLFEMGDSGCIDGDGDGVANDQDLCPTVADHSNLDFDGDGVGNACDSFARITGVEQGTLDARSPGTRLTFWGTQSGPWTLRVGGASCTDGVVLDSGDYTASGDRLTPTPGLAVVPAAQLPEGVVSLRLCIDSLGGTVSDVTSVLHDTSAPALGAPQLNAADDTGSSSTDGVTRSTSYTLSGTAEPASTLTLREHGTLLTSITVGPDGTWSYLEPGPVSEGLHSYEATAEDTAGNRSTSNGGILVDLTPPTAAITAGPAEGGSSTSSTGFSFTASEGSSFQCRVDSGAWVGCASPYSLTGLEPGQHTLELRATDLAGNVASDTVARHWVVTGFNWTGFFDPVENEPAVNAAKAGSSLPVKFSLGRDAGLAVLASGSPTSRNVGCNGEATTGQPESVAPAGSSGLSYDASTGTYTYVWKTAKGWAGGCRRFTLTLTDGSSHSFLVRLR